MDLKNKILKKQNLNLFFLWIFFVSPNICAQDTPATSNGDLTFYLDHASFAGSDEKTYTEFYLMFYADQLAKNVDQRESISEIEIELSIKDKNNKDVTNRTWILEIDNAGTNSNSKVIYDKFADELFAGEYDLKLRAKDIHGKSSGIINTNIDIPKFEIDGLSVSDIEFINSAENKSNGSPFIKGKLKIIPNPTRRYGILNSRLSFYYEIYGLDLNSSDLQVDYTITDKINNTHKKLEDIKIKKPGNSATVIHGIDISNLGSGIYTFNAKIKDTAKNDSIKVSRNFEIIQADFFQHENLLTKENAQIFETILSYIGSPEQLKVYKSLNLAAKAEFMIQYWKNSDPDPSSEENEYLKEIQKRFNHAKNNFKWHTINGWETDRGRICIKYGIPHQVNQYSSEADSTPYEIWIYNENKIYEFVFGDIRSDGRYILLHSNKEGEIYNSNWRERQF